MRVPPGLKAGSIELELFRQEPEVGGIYEGNGRLFRTKTAEDGSFAQSYLAAGEWLVRISPPGTLARQLGWSEERRNVERLPYVVVVHDGSVSRLDVDLSENIPCILSGRFSVDGVALNGSCSLILPGPLGLILHSAVLEESGSFILQTRAPGTYRLVVYAGVGHGNYRTLTDLVRVVPGPTRWEQDLSIEKWNSDSLRLDPH